MVHILGLNEEDADRARELALRFDQFRHREAVFGAKGKPAKYRVNLIGLGRVGYEFSEQLLKYFRNDPFTLCELVIWHPIKRQIKGKSVVDVEPADSKQEMLRDLLHIMVPGEEGRVQLKGYRSLSDLDQLILKSHEDPTVGDITVLTSRYDMNFGTGEGRDRRLLDPRDRLDGQFLESLVRVSVYDPSNTMDVSSTVAQFREQRQLMAEIVTKVMEETGLQENRAMNLVDSVLGTRELAKVFAGSNVLPVYNGDVFVAVNEVDTTSQVFAKQSHMHPGRVAGLSHNDQLRITRCLKKQMPEHARSFPFAVPVVGAHNEFAVAVRDLVRYRTDKWLPLSTLTRASVNWDDIHEQAANFGLRLYTERGSSDQDAPLALLNMVQALVFEDLRGGGEVRISARHGKDDFFIGLPSRYDANIAVPRLDVLRHMNQDERIVFEQGVQVQESINAELIRETLIPNNWDYKEEKPEPLMPEARPGALRRAVQILGEGVTAGVELLLGNPPVHEHREVAIPSDLEVRLYAHASSSNREAQRVHEFDIRSSSPLRTFNFDLGKYAGVEKIVAADEFLYVLCRKGRAGEYQIVVTDLSTGKTARTIDLGIREPSDFDVTGRDVYVSYEAASDALLRVENNGRKSNYTGANNLQTVVAYKVQNVTRILGASANELFRWNKSTPRKAAQLALLRGFDDALYHLRHHSNGVNLISAKCGDNAMVCMDAEGQLGFRTFQTYEGRYDIAMLDDSRIVVATADLDTGHSRVKLFDSIDKLIKGRGRTMLDPEDMPSIGQDPEITGLRLAGNLLFVFDRFARIMVLDWTNPKSTPGEYSPAGANLYCNDMLVR